MNNIVKHKKSVLTILLALVLGGLIGWGLKPSAVHEDHEPSASHQHDASSDEVWTCSMHPQIRQSEPGQCPICGMDLVPVASAPSVSATNPLVHSMTPEAIAMANIHTSSVKGVSPEGEVLLTGKVQADEQQIASITAKFPGRIERLFVNFTGQRVQPGERLASVYSPELRTAQQELLEAAKLKGTYPELYTAAREKLKLWKLTEKQIDAVETSGKVSDQLAIVADKGGVVIQRNIAVGDYVNTGSVLFKVVDLSRVWIMIDAYETDLPFIEIGDAVSFTVAALPGKTFEAKVTYIDPIINPETRAASVRAETANPKGALKPEMFVTARIQSDLEAQASSLAIPRTALLWSGKRSVVYVKVPDADMPSYEMREITIGPRMGDMYLVEAGLEAGEEIVTNGVFAVDAAAQLSGNYSMMSRPESKTMDVPQAFRQQITAVAEAYFDVKNALVDSDGAAAKQAAAKAQSTLGQVEMRLLQGQAHDRWMALASQFAESLTAFEGAENLEKLREHFSSLSQHMLEITESFGLEKEKVYKDFCPMVFGDEGAYWLSETEEIRNPYFGEQMLGCGELTETYRKGSRVFEEGRGQPQPSADHQH